MERSISFLFFSALITLFSIGCRAPQVDQGANDDGMTVTPLPKPSPTQTEQPNTRHPFSPRLPILPTETRRDEEPQEFTTIVYLNAACDMNPSTMAVVAGRTEPALCEHIIGIPIFEYDGEMFELAREFDWSSEAAGDISISCKSGPHDDFCWAVGHHDLFDMWDGMEPSSFIMACTNNTCTDEMPYCQPIVCSSVMVYSVVNLEGTWTLAWSSVPGGETVTLTQEGRLFGDAATHVKNGFVDGAHVSFDQGDYHFEGDLTSDRTHMNGEMWDLIMGSPAGSWSMTRAAP